MKKLQLLKEKSLICIWISQHLLIFLPLEKIWHLQTKHLTYVPDFDVQQVCPTVEKHLFLKLVNINFLQLTWRKRVITSIWWANFLSTQSFLNCLTFLDIKVLLDSLYIRFYHFFPHHISRVIKQDLHVFHIEFGHTLGSMHRRVIDRIADGHVCAWAGAIRRNISSCIDYTDRHLFI